MGKVFSFSCLRWALVLLNLLYTIVGLVLVGLVIASKATAFFSEPHILIGTAISGSLMVFIAIFGLVGAIKHHQIILFFYMIILAISTILMFGVSVGALAAPSTLQQSFLRTTWKSLSNQDKTQIQNGLNCCGFSSTTQNNGSIEDTSLSHPSCNTATLRLDNYCCHRNISSSIKSLNVTVDPECPDCQPCYEKWHEEVDKTVRIAGAVGLVFSFTQIAGIIVTYRYRNEKDPSINPNSYL